jgi:hypothetical protein
LLRLDREYTKALVSTDAASSVRSPPQRVQEGVRYSAEGLGVAAESVLAIPTLLSTYWVYSAPECMPPFLFSSSLVRRLTVLTDADWNAYKRTVT